ncbi:hypothetical protein EDC01DRAFT_780360 [Geopyxis carbonaria]|nr:hypothetical protein EDC01DRAFT_780360 [Geopyxis carbonaria]
MAEAAATIAGLLCFVGQTAQTAIQLHGFFATILSAPQEIKALQTNLLGLHGILLELMGALECSPVDIGRGLGRAIEECAGELENIGDVVRRLGSTNGVMKGGRRLWKGVKWAFSEKDIAASVQGLERRKQTLMLALSGLSLEMDVQAAKRMQGLQGSMDRLAAQNHGMQQQSEAIRRSLGTISKHIETTTASMTDAEAMHASLVKMIQATVAETVRETLAQTLTTTTSSSATTTRQMEYYSERRIDVPALEFPAEFQDAPGSRDLVWPAAASPSKSALSDHTRNRRYSRFNTTFGNLLVYFSSSSTHISDTDTARFEAGFTFIPAPWMFKTAFAASFMRSTYAFGQTKMSTSMDVFSVVPESAPILQYCRTGNLAGVQSLFTQRLARPSDRDENGRTLLHWSSAMGHVELTRLLLSLGADPSVPNNLARTPLHWTTLLSCNVEIVRLLIAHGCDPSLPNIAGQSTLFTWRTDMPQLLDAMVHQDSFVVDIDHTDHWGRTPLMWELLSERTEHLDSTRALLDAHASITRRDDMGLTPLHLLLLSTTPKSLEKKASLKLLLQRGADPAARSEDGLTPTDIADQRGMRDVWETALAECGIVLSGATESAVSTAVAAAKPRSALKRRACTWPESRSEATGVSKSKGQQAKQEQGDSPAKKRRSARIARIPRRALYELFEDAPAGRGREAAAAYPTSQQAGPPYARPGPEAAAADPCGTCYAGPPYAGPGTGTESAAAYPLSTQPAPSSKAAAAYPSLSHYPHPPYAGPGPESGGAYLDVVWLLVDRGEGE